ncbi:transporter substrate-binding domain-containing protein [Actinomadura macra]|uniref:transporter substrate-binding domain-containing protein n=1 Tax=Actinomadura macra TaxID=46164 RepID=UPI0008327CF7|nr:transporter substrate-binding domain-containing protein [Actinomadura macra]
MHQHRRWLAVVIATAFGLAGTAACGDTAPPPAQHGPLYQMRNALNIGVKFDQPGIGECNPAATRCNGLDIDIAREVAAALHDTPVFRPVVSSNREDMLLKGAVHLIIASYSISDERLKIIDFAGPYFIAGQDVLTRNGDTRITDVDDLKDKVTCGADGSNSPRRLASRFGGTESTGNAWGRKHLKLVDGFGDCLPLLLDKTVDAVSTDDSILAGYANQPRYKGKVRLLGKRFTTERYGIGMAKGNPIDRALITRILTQMIQDGRWERIVNKNLGAAAPLFLTAENRPTPVK